MYTYPVIDCYATVQGEGVSMAGQPIILVRFGTKGGWSNAHLESTRPVPFETMELDVLVAAIEQARELYPTTSMVHFTGDEPMLNPMEPLIDALHDANPGFRVGMDTCGAFALTFHTLKRLDFLSVGPKPGLHVDPEMWVRANELRYYLRTGVREFEDLLRDDLERSTELRGRGLVIPYALTQEDIDYALHTSLELGLRFHIPTYRAINGFDRNLNGGDACQICNLQDTKAGVNTQLATPTSAPAPELLGTIKDIDETLKGQLHVDTPTKKGPGPVARQTKGGVDVAAFMRP